jgi:methyl-accepting chemotaxis protein
MRFSSIQTGTKILGAFAAVSAAIVVICMVALWRMQAADAITRDLVDNRLARQQLTSELLGMARLNGAHAIAIARSDSLEAGDYFQARLDQGEKDAAALASRLAALPSEPGERALMARAASARAAYLAVRKQVFQAKDLGKTQEVERLASAGLASTYDAWVKALDTLLAHQTRQARDLAAASGSASLFSRALLLAVGGAALLLGGAAGWLLTRSIVAPLQDAVQLAERVARGDLSATIRHARGDEIGRLFDALNHMTGGVSATVVKVLDSARLIDGASADIAAGNRDLSRRTDHQAGSLHATVRSMAELTEGGPAEPCERARRQRTGVGGVRRGARRARTPSPRWSTGWRRSACRPGRSATSRR